MVILVAGPSGVGKSRLVEEACRLFGFRTVVPVTTRSARPDEVPGKDYEFVSKASFMNDIRAGRFFCWDFVLGNFYGYRDELKARALQGERLIVQILARMGARVASGLPDAQLLFLDAVDDRLLEERLSRRLHDDDNLVARRIHWREERALSGLFDLVVADADTAEASQLAAVLSELVERWE